MREGFVYVKNSPIFVVTEGKWIEEKFYDNENELILLIPGNPGFADFYTHFIEMLYNKTKLPIWALSYAGHEIPPKEFRESEKYNENNNNEVRLYNLKEQIDHMIDFIRTYVPPHVKINILGHSCGSWMTLELLKSSEIKHQIKKCYCLFPALERLQETNGFFFIKNFIIPCYPFLIILAKIFHPVPLIVKLLLFRLIFLFFSLPDNLMKPSLKIINPYILPNIIHLAKDERLKISRYDEKLLNENKNLIKLVYGKTDPFVPIKFYYRLKQAIPDIDAELTQMDHAFMVKCNEELTDNLTKWISNS